MKLLIIVLSLLSERYLIHGLSAKRFEWFKSYYHFYENKAKDQAILNNPQLVFLFCVLVPVITLWVLEATLGELLFGFVGFVLNFIVLFYCLGPDNPFYPVRDSDKTDDEVLGRYFDNVNESLFAPIFWFVLAGPLGVLTYRMLWLYTHFVDNSVYGRILLPAMNWIPVRLSALLYLFVGQFQPGFAYLSSKLFTPAQQNSELLTTVSLMALKKPEETVDFSEAESRVFHSLIVFLVFLAALTLVAWID